MAITDSQSLPKSLTLKSFSGNAPTRKIGFCFKSDGFRAGDITLVVNAIAQILKKPAKD
jgi:hypothetical protein